MHEHKILVIKGMGIGDIILGIPLLRNLRKRFPDSRISIINTSGPGREILKGCPYIDEILSLDDAYKGLGFKIKFLNLMRKKRFDIVIDSFPTTSNTALLCSLINAKKSIGFANNKLSSLYNVKIPFDRKKNIVEIEKGILDYLGEKDYDDSLELFFDIKRAPDWSKIEGGKPKGKIVCISAGKDIDKIRTWDDVKWAKIADYIANDYDASIMIIGGEHDVNRAKNIEMLMMENAIVLAGKMTIEDTARLFHASELLVCINGGAMHLAVASGCKVIALNGSSGYFWDAYCKDAISIRDRGLNCMPCESFQCKLNGKEKYKCMRNIKEFDVKNMIKSALEIEKSKKLRKKYK